MRFSKTSKICLLILCLLPYLATGTPQFRGASFCMVPLFDRVSKSHYNRVHRWLADTFGKASVCEFCNIGDQRYTWALKKGCEYDFIKDNFIQLCYKCHQKYDCHPGRDKRISEKLKGQFCPWLNKAVLRIDGDVVTEYISVKEASLDSKVCRGAIHNCLSGLTKTSGGFKWKYKNVHE